MVGAAGTTYQAVAVSLAGSAAAMRAVERMSARTRRPPLVLAALHDLALAGRAPALAAAYAGGDAEAAAQAAVETVVERADDVAARASGRRVLTGETGAGKSILLDAFSLAIGGRGDTSLVRRGAGQGQVTAVFDLPAPIKALVK